MSMRPTYCYWSVATGPYAELMARCVASARAAGVFKEFHVMTDRPIQGAESYEAYEVELTDKLFKLVYLKAAISKLNFDYYVWVDADTLFHRNPRNLLASLSRSPIHVPLEINLSALIADADGRRSQSGTAASAAPATGQPGVGQSSWATGMPIFQGVNNDGETASGAADVDAVHARLHGLSIRDYVKLFAAAGVSNPVYWSRSAFWIIRRTAIERVCELALHFRAFVKDRGATADATAGLSFAMQMLCADPAKHELFERPDLWASAAGRAVKAESDAADMEIKYPLVGAVTGMKPAIVHWSQSLSPDQPGLAASKVETPRELVYAK